MRIIEILSEDLILPDVSATDKSSVLEEVVDRVAQVRPEVDRTTAVRLLLAREKLGTTAVGQGYAIPHAKLPELDKLVACFARSRRGVEFEALDGEPAHLFLTLFAPDGAAGLHLKALARASRLFRLRSFRDRLMSEEDSQGLWKLIQEQDEQLSKRDEQG